MLLSALLIHFLLPHESNNHRARLLHPIFVTLSLLMFLLTQAMMPLLPQFTPAVLGYASNIPPERVVELTNAEREKFGMPPLNLDPALTQAALTKASDMFVKDYWSHVSPDGLEPWYFFIQSGYKYRFAGENLARDFSNAEEVVAAWSASPTHRENLLASRYQDIGVAVVDGELNGVETTLVVQFFGTTFSAASAVSTIGEIQAAGSSGLAAVEPGSGIRVTKLLISPFSSTKRAAIFFVSLFFTLLSIDMVLVKQKNVSRKSSKSFAHLLFYGVILVAIWLAEAGSIL